MVEDYGDRKPIERCRFFQRVDVEPPAEWVRFVLCPTISAHWVQCAGDDEHEGIHIGANARSAAPSVARPPYSVIALSTELRELLGGMQLGAQSEAVRMLGIARELSVRLEAGLTDPTLLIWSGLRQVETPAAREAAREAVRSAHAARAARDVVPPTSRDERIGRELAAALAQRQPPAVVEPWVYFLVDSRSGLVAASLDPDRVVAELADRVMREVRMERADGSYSIKRVRNLDAKKEG